MKRTQEPGRAVTAWPVPVGRPPGLGPTWPAGAAWPAAPAWPPGVSRPARPDRSPGASRPARPAWPAWPAGQIQIRQAGRADHGALRDFLAGLSVQTRYLRFFGGALPTSPALLRVLAGERPDADVLVATQNGAIIGHAMAVDSAGPGGGPTAELGVVVADAWQGRGVGTGLVRALAARARARGVTAVMMEVMAENQRVLAMIAGRWPGARHDRSGAYVTVHARLDQQGGTASGALTSSA
jgi:GNAT superfamily N-acetyltransferase